MDHPREAFVVTQSDVVPWLVFRSACSRSINAPNSLFITMVRASSVMLVQSGPRSCRRCPSRNSCDTVLFRLLALPDVDDLTGLIEELVYPGLIRQQAHFLAHIQFRHVAKTVCARRRDTFPACNSPPHRSPNLNGTVEGDANATVSKLSKIEEGRSRYAFLLANPAYQYVYTTTASIVIIGKDFALSGKTTVRVADAQGAFAKVLSYTTPSSWTRKVFRRRRRSVTAPRLATTATSVRWPSSART